LFVNQIGTNEIFSILPGECLPFHWYARKEGRQLRVRLDDAAYDWSGAFEVQLCRTESLKLHRKDVAESDTQKRFAFFKFGLRLNVLLFLKDISCCELKASQKAQRILYSLETKAPSIPNTLSITRPTKLLLLDKKVTTVVA
jgi:hypothetical protein